MANGGTPDRARLLQVVVGTVIFVLIVTVVIPLLAGALSGG